MPRTIFLSFLGTNNYIHCNYYLETEPTKRVENVQYIQEALIRIHEEAFSENDQIITFVTQKAHDANYLDNGHFDINTKTNIPSEGLAGRLKALQTEGVLKCDFEEVRIKEGFSETEIWEVFESVASRLKPNDVVYFDITHAFRFLPMMGLVLINYLKATKNVSLKAIHYGAFEKLGAAFEVKKLDISERNAPILNLTSLIELNQWTDAASNFSKYGLMDGLKNLTIQSVNPILKETRGKDLMANNLRMLGDALSKLIPNIQTNRGAALLNFEQQKLKALLEAIDQADISIKPFKEVLALIENKLKPLIETKHIWLESAKWCLEHGLYQQGITQLQEGIITHIILVFQKLENFKPDFFKTDSVECRKLISSVLNISSKNILKENWTTELSDHSFVEKLVQETIIQDFASLFAKFTTVRNDINHGGYKKDDTTSDTFKSKLESFIKHTETLLNAKPCPQ